MTLTIPQGIAEPLLVGQMLKAWPLQFLGLVLSGASFSSPVDPKPRDTDDQVVQPSGPSG